MSEKRSYTVKQYIGSTLCDLPYYLATFLQRNGWVSARNRNDRLEWDSNGVAVRLVERWSSDLHACHVFPDLGRRLLQKAFQCWPIAGKKDAGSTDNPDISFIIPFRGPERLPLLRAVIESIHSQSDADVECLIIEQSQRQELNIIPQGANYLHLPHYSDDRWRKSWANNVGVRSAKADVIVFHDADILVPSAYAREVLNKIAEGYDVVHPQRFLFCLNQKATQNYLSDQGWQDIAPERVRQNWQGGTLAIRKESFNQLGGYDESFVDWGGEDNEFYDRCLTLNGWRYGYLPFIHLWHEPQKTKVNNTREQNLARLRHKLSIPSEQRINQLLAMKEKKSW